MKIKKKKIYWKRTGMAVLCLAVLWTAPAYAGNINDAEQKIIDYYNRTFYYEGKSYVATEAAKAAAYNELIADGTDMTENQAKSAIRQASKNIRQGIADGYLVEVEPEEPQDSEESRNPEGSEEPSDPEESEESRDPEESKNPKKPEGSEEPSDPEESEESRGSEESKNSRKPEGSEESEGSRKSEKSKTPGDTEASEEDGEPEDTEALGEDGEPEDTEASGDSGEPEKSENLGEAGETENPGKPENSEQKTAKPYKKIDVYKLLSDVRQAGEADVGIQMAEDTAAVTVEQYPQGRITAVTEDGYVLLEGGLPIKNTGYQTGRNLHAAAVILGLLLSGLTVLAIRLIQTRKKERNVQGRMK